MLLAEYGFIPPAFWNCVDLFEFAYGLDVYRLFVLRFVGR
jgi:hypothetical protein